jgi:hypothetical protein
MARYPVTPNTYPSVRNAYPATANVYPVTVKGWPPSAGPTLVAPTMIGVTSTISTTGTTRTVDLSPLQPRRGDRIRVHICSRVTDAGAALVITLPSGQGWTKRRESIGASFANCMADKIWGEDGQTDTMSPIFTLSIGGTWGAICTNLRGTGGLTQSVQWTLTSATATQTAPLLTTAPVSTSMITSTFATTDDNALKTPSRGTLLYGDTTYNLGTIAAAAEIYEAGVDASVTAASVQESANGNDVGRTMTAEWAGAPASTDQISTFMVTGHGRSNINGTGWRCASSIYPLAIGGLLYEHMAMVSGSPTRSLTIGYRTSANNGSTWSAWTTYNSGTIANPAGIGNWADDGHFTATIGLSKNHNVQVFLLAHSLESSMQFWQGTGGPTDISLDAADLAVWTPPAAWLKSPASYPRLTNIPSDGTAILMVRDGAPGADATIRLFEQSSASDTVWLDATPSGIMDFVTAGDEESPYLDQVVIDSTDALHCSFLWAQTNTTVGYHGKMYFKMTRTSPGNWVCKDVDGTTLTMPFDQTKAIARDIPLDSGYTPNCGIGLNNDNTPLLPYIMGEGGSAGDTRLWLTMRVNGAWVNRDLGLVATGWNLIGAPPKSERGNVRVPTALYRNGTIYVLWTSDYDLGPGNFPYIAAKSSSDNGATWSPTYRFVNEEVGDWAARYDTTAFYNLGILHIPFQMVDNASVWGNPLTTPAFVIQIPA